MAFNTEVYNMDINEFVKGLNDPRLKESIRKLGNTPEGQKILGSKIGRAHV